MYHVMNSNMNKKNNSNNATNNNATNNENKILLDYFNSMYLDCIHFCNSVNNENTINRNIQKNQCDFIKEKIHNLKQTQTPKTTNNLTNIIYAVAK